MHGHHAAQAPYRILTRMLLNKRVPQSDSLAKYAVAFLRNPLAGVCYWGQFKA
ncbi:hypothetical protein GCM10009022_40430 [Vreelandella titanicae]